MITRRLAALAAWALLAVAWLWALLALWFFGHWPIWVRLPLAAAWVAFLPAALVLLPRRRAPWAVAAGAVVIWLGWSWQRPSNDRPWTPDQERMPLATFDGNRVTIRNLRHATYRDTDDYDVRWCTRQYDLDGLATVDFAVEPFSSWRGPAHTFLTFGFDDGRYVAVSVEIRKEQGESFSPLAGIFRQYEIMYVVGDERDLLGLRVDVRKNPVHLYPIRATKEELRELLVAMLDRANRLAERPEFYNTLTNSCTSNIIRHVEELTEREMPLDWRKLLPGYSDEVAFEMGLIDTDGSLEDARRRFRVPTDRPPAADAQDWSRQIRRGRTQ